MSVGEELAREQVARILQSETFRTSEVLRRLLKFLADKSFAGEADQLKEYTIGIDALGRPAGYDPRVDSGVRIQVGRLRQKLTDFYINEGKDDPVVVEVPKGRFRLSFEHRQQPPIPSEEPPVQPAAVLTAPAKTASGRTVRILVASLVLAVSWGVVTTAQLWRGAPSAGRPSGWTSDMEELWQPILSSTRPLVISVSAPLFVGLQKFGMCRVVSINRWEDALISPEVGAVRKALNDPRIAPMYYFTGYGNMSAVFRLGQLLGSADPGASVTRSDLMSWQQVVDSNVIFVGPPRLNAEQLRSLPIELQFDLDQQGLVNRHPKPGEPAHMADSYPSIRGAENIGGVDSGEIHTLITHTPGPMGAGHIECFNSNHSPGTLAGVQAFTTPGLARTIVNKLRKPDGKLPPYYQVVLKVRYKDGVPTEITYVNHAELHPASLTR